MEIKQKLVSSSKYDIKCPYEREPQFYVVHNTYNDAAASNEVAYMIRNDNKVSFHYAVDDVEVVQGLLENRSAFASGDGGKGQGNLYGIHVEICYSKSGGDRFIKAEQNAAKFIADGLKAHGWGIDKVKKHQDFANKYCPHRTLDMGWQRFLNMVQANLDGNQTVVTPTPQPSQPVKPSGYDEWVARLQQELNYQFKRGLTVDGLKGPNTLNACPTVKKGAKGNVTRLIQERLNSVGFSLGVDGIFGTATYNAVKVFQRNRGLSQDGIVGKNTWNWLLKGTKM
jgi:N-acetylmuramoyl-L-alanine amidase CwlA